MLGFTSYAIEPHLSSNTLGKEILIWITTAWPGRAGIQLVQLQLVVLNTLHVELHQTNGS